MNAHVHVTSMLHLTESHNGIPHFRKWLYKQTANTIIIVREVQKCIYYTGLNPTSESKNPLWD